MSVAHDLATFQPETAVARLSAVSLASVLDQSVDCVKLVNLAGNIQYMNGNGLCAMEIDDFCSIAGAAWADLWPEEARHGGTVDVSAAQDQRVLTITWHETCHQPVQHRAREGGQGMGLMSQIMRTRGGNLVVAWADHGLTATLTFQLAT